MCPDEFFSLDKTKCPDEALNRICYKRDCPFLYSVFTEANYSSQANYSPFYVNTAHCASHLEAGSLDPTCIARVSADNLPLM